jgi:branched-chain amino acid aminotransferase
MSAATEVVVWVDGKVQDAEAATVRALDHGLTVGDGVFETCKVTDGVPFALTRHLQRLDRSAAGLGLPLADHAVVRDAVSAVLAARPFALGRLRLTWTGGPGPLGSDRAGAEPTLVVAAQLASPWPQDIGAVRVPWTRNERSATAGLKTTSYAENVVALAYARERGGNEALFANTRGGLCEGTGSNVFVVLDGELVTPPLDAGPLAGITRALLLEWATDEGLPCVERSLPFDVLDRVDEVLLTSSTRDVQPVARLDGRALVPGGLSRAAVELFDRRSRKDPDPV